MILGVDPALATCGWAVVDPTTCEVLDFGVLETKRDPAPDKSTDFARRASTIARALAYHVGSWGCSRIAAEQALFHGTTNAVVPQVLTWGALAALASVLDVELAEVPAKTWQRAVVPTEKKAIPYAAVERELAKLAGHRLLRLPKNLRTHALDAIGVGVFAARRPATKVVP